VTTNDIRDIINEWQTQTPEAQKQGHEDTFTEYEETLVKLTELLKDKKDKSVVFNLSRSKCRQNTSLAAFEKQEKPMPRTVPQVCGNAFCFLTSKIPHKTKECDDSFKSEHNSESAASKPAELGPEDLTPKDVVQALTSPSLKTPSPKKGSFHSHCSWAHGQFESESESEEIDSDNVNMSHSSDLRNVPKAVCWGEVVQKSKQGDGAETCDEQPPIELFTEYIATINALQTNLFNERTTFEAELATKDVQIADLQAKLAVNPQKDDNAALEEILQWLDYFFKEIYDLRLELEDSRNKRDILQIEYDELMQDFLLVVNNPKSKRRKVINQENVATKARVCKPVTTNARRHKPVATKARRRKRRGQCVCVFRDVDTFKRYQCKNVQKRGCKRCAQCIQEKNRTEGVTTRERDPNWKSDSDKSDSDKSDSDDKSTCT